jgi:hypothetical protein
MWWKAILLITLGSVVAVAFWILYGTSRWESSTRKLLGRTEKKGDVGSKTT